MPIPRTPGTSWLNDHPLTSFDEVLSILSTETETGEPAHLAQYKTGEGFIWEIVVPCAAHPRSGRNTAGKEEYLQVDKRVVEALDASGNLMPYRRAYWSGVSDDTRLVATEEARHASCAHLQHLLGHALTLLASEVTEEHASTAIRGRFGRTGYRFGPLYVEYKLSSGKRYKIFPERNEISVEY